MPRTPEEEKRRVAEMLSRPDRPLQRIQDQQFPGQAARRRAREVELQSSTAMERVLDFFANLGRAVGLH